MLSVSRYVFWTWSFSISVLVFKFSLVLVFRKYTFKSCKSLKMKGKQLDGSHGRMSEPSRQTVVVRKRMSKPYVPYGIKRYRRIGQMQV